MKHRNGRLTFKHCLLGAIAFCYASSFAAAATQPYRFSVERLLRLADGTPASPPLPNWDIRTTTRIAKEQASLYLAGVKDAGEGNLWCMSELIQPPHEVDEQIFALLRKRPSHANAALELGRIFQEMYPCNSQTQGR